MGFIFEHDQPVFFFTVDFSRHVDAAGVDLFRFVQIIRQSQLLDVLRADDGEIHQRDILLRDAFAVNLFSDL